MIRKGIIVTRDGARFLGGPGSGNFGHAGIPGQRGGSAPRGSGGGGSQKPEPRRTDRHAAGKGDAEGHWNMKMSKAEHAALQKYGGSGYTDINKGLYDPPPGKDIQKTIKDLDAVMDRAELSTDTTVYSGLGSRASAMMADLDVGSEVDFAGYLSTTTDENIARGFSTNVKDGRKTIQRRLQFDLPKGANAFHMGDKDYEKEVMLPRGKKLVIKNISTSKNKYRENIVTYHMGLK